jgi:lipoprotein-anchoring transpeptidase ErfK/SrfK
VAEPTRSGALTSMLDTDPSRRRRLPWPAFVLPWLLLAVALAGCGAATSSGHTHGATAPVGSTSTGSTSTASTSTASTTSATHADVSTPKARPATVPTTVVAIVKRAVPLRSAPETAGHVIATLATHTQFGSVTAMPVVKRRGSWLGVISVLAGNGRIGWIPASATSLTTVGWRIYISIDRQQITVLYGNQVIKHFVTSTGVAGANTPTGRFAVTDRLTTGVEYGPYGCCILALSGIQPRHLSDWDGGYRIAIHATDDTAALGHPASHGCAHVSDANGRWLLAHIPDGTPVVIANAPFHPGRGSPA